MVSLRRERGSHPGGARGPSTRGLEKGDAKENSDDPPLVLVNPVEYGANLIFQGLAAEPNGRQTNHDAGDEEGEELLRSHLQVADEKTHDVGTWHQEHSEPASTHGGAFCPLVNARHFAHLGFRPSQGALTKDAACEIQSRARGQDAEEADAKEREGVDERNGSKEVSVSGTEDEDEDGVVVDECGADIATDCSCGEEDGSDDQ